MVKEHWIVLGAFLVGCVLTNLLGGNLLTTYGILNDYFLNQYSCHAIDGNRLFCHILFERGKAAVTIFLLGRVMSGRLFSLVIKSVVAVTNGFLITVAMINLGMRGIVICMCALFPQWMFYFAALLYYVDCRKEAELRWRGNSTKENFLRNFSRGGILFLSMMLGIFTECYVNPVLLTYVLKIF